MEKEPVVLFDDGFKIKHVIQISDIHIRLFKRSKEYYSALQLAVDEVAKRNKNECVPVIITGDTIHTKLELSPEMVAMVSWFLKELSKITKVLIIPGQHDANLNNRQRLDAITPIVDTIASPNIFYLKDTGLYRFDDCIFSVMSIFDAPEKYITADKIDDSPYKKMALFHGTIDTSLLDTGHRLESKTAVSFFDGFEIVFLGDIHLQQILQKYNAVKKKPAMAYIGSLLQQNHGESLENHGIAIWNLETRDFEFKQIQNDYGFITINVDNGVANADDLKNIPKNARVRLKLNNTTSTQLKDFLIDFRSNHNVEELSLNRIGSSIQNNEESQSATLMNLRSVDFQNKLIEEYLRTHYTITDELVEKVLKINERLNEKIKPAEYARMIVWKPKLFEFSNMFSYGEDNVVDFTKMDGIVGLFSANASGKTSLLEALTFCLFDTTSRTSIAADILNNRKNKFTCKLNFEVGGADYFIEKIATKKSGKVSVKIDFWRTDADGNIEDLSGTQRADTKSIVSKYIGTYDDFILTTMLTQKDPASFIDLGQAKRKDLLTKFMDLGIFDELEELAKAEFKLFETKIKEFEKRDFDEEIAIIMNQLPAIENAMKSMKEEKEKVQSERNEHNQSLISLAKKIIPIDESIKGYDIEYLESQKDAVEERAENYQKKNEEMANGLSQVLNESKEVKSKVNLFDVEQIDIHVEELSKERELQSSLEKEISDLKIHITHKMDKINKLGKLEYDPNCKYCMNNIFVKDAISTKQSLEEDKIKFVQLNETLQEIKLKVDALVPYKAQKEEYEKLRRQLDKCQKSFLDGKSKIDSNRVRIEECKASIKDCESKMELYNKSEKDIIANAKVESEMAIFTGKIDALDKYIKALDARMMDSNSMIVSNKMKIKTIEEEIQKARDIEDSYYAYENYLNVIKRDGIPYDLISKIVPTMESEVNNILNQIVDFSIIFELNNKDVDGKIVYDENRIWPFEMASGFEKFVISLAIRNALISISNLSRASFLCLDEGFTTMDADNISNIPIIFDYLRSQFDFAIVISHMESMRDFVDTSLNLKKEDNYSKIVFN